MKNVEVLGINFALSELNAEGLYGVKFSHALIKNAKTFEEEAEKIKSTLVYPEEFLVYNKEMEKTFKEHALKDENGELVVTDNKYQIAPEKIEIFKEIEREKREANSEVLNKAKEIEDKYNDALDNENVNVSIVYVKLEELPETITPDQMSALSFMIEDI